MRVLITSPGGAASKIFHHGSHGRHWGNIIRHQGIRDTTEGSDEV
jgi:hypothetical protein